MAVVVSDASVLICLGALGQLELLREFYETITVPDAIWHEVTGCPNRPGAAEALSARQQGWLLLQNPVNEALVLTLRAKLDVGEAAAIALAAELHASLLLVDESDARAAARQLAIPVTGTIGVLARAKREGKIPAIRPLLDRLIHQYQFRLAHSLYVSLLTQLGELR